MAEILLTKIARVHRPEGLHLTGNLNHTKPRPTMRSAAMSKTDTKSAEPRSVRPVAQRRRGVPTSLKIAPCSLMPYGVGKSAISGVWWLLPNFPT